MRLNNFMKTLKYMNDYLKMPKKRFFLILLELLMAPSAIVLTKVARKRRSFEAGDIAQKAQCLSEAEYSDVSVFFNIKELLLVDRIHQIIFFIKFQINLYD